MCGIAALFAPEARPLTPLVRAMCALAHHRGPDDEGYAVFESSELAPQVFGGADTPDAVFASGLAYAPERGRGDGALAMAAIGHRRLSIVDLSAAGHQPMCSADQRLWIVYNGEIYNHVELRSELAAAGVRFASSSDTEVILAAYARWGERCVERFNGMFAFVLVDRASRRVFAARDRFGVKPLYRWRSPDGLVAFASEIKQFSALPGWRARLAHQPAYDYLNWGLFDHGSATLFAGVDQLRGGETIAADLSALGDATPARWYELIPRRFTGGEAKAADEVRALFTDAVRLRLRADVTVGSCLSGGLDSSSIVCVAHELLRAGGATEPQMTFSARAEAGSVDESAFAGEVIAATGVRGHFTLPSLDELFELLPRLTWHHDEPFGSTSIFAQWKVFELAAAHRVKVMLDGQGADEIFAGYHDYFGVRFAELARSLRWGELARDVAATRRLHGLTLHASAMQALNRLLPEIARRPLRAVVGKETALSRMWLGRERLRANEVQPARDEARTLRDVLIDQVLFARLPMLLHWEDRNSMAHSIESRVPFLDYRLVELVLGLPDELKLARGVTKRVLRQAMSGILPDRIRDRTDKVGFATPEQLWMRERAPDRFRAALDRAIEQSRGVLSPGARELLEQTIDGRRPHSFLPWRLISFGAWMERFAVELGAG